MKKQIRQRVLSLMLVLVLVMILGMVPTTLSTRTEAVTPEEQAASQTLLNRIREMEDGLGTLSMCSMGFLSTPVANI